MASDKITAVQVLLPVTLLSVAMAGFLCFQTSLLFADRTSLHQAYDQQTKPIEQVAKVKGQLDALAVGTLALSKQGNKDAATIIAQLKKAGIDVAEPAAAPAPGPAKP